MQSHSRFLQVTEQEANFEFSKHFSPRGTSLQSRYSAVENKTSTMAIFLWCIATHTFALPTGRTVEVEPQVQTLVQRMDLSTPLLHWLSNVRAQRGSLMGKKKQMNAICKGGKKLKLPSALVLHSVKVNGIFCGIKWKSTSVQIGKMINLWRIDELNPHETALYYTKR